MLKICLLPSILFSITISTYLPMSDKKHNFGDHICKYTDTLNSINYVKPCEADKYCSQTEISGSNNFYLFTCQKDYHIRLPTQTKKAKDEACNVYNNECMSGLTCTGSGSTYKCDISCSSDRQATLINGKYECRNPTYNNLCEFTKTGSSMVESHINRNIGKVCGKINFTTKKKDESDTNSKTYQALSSVEECDYYSQKDGTFVNDINACESGTALYFYGDNGTKDVNDVNTDSSTNPYNDEKNKMYLKCVTIKEVDCGINGNQIIKYTIKENDQDVEKLYDFNDVDEYGVSSSLSTSTGHYYAVQRITQELDQLYNNYPLTKIELWEDYKQARIKYNECMNSDLNNQPEDCLDDDMRRKFYYYTYPENYLLYKDQKEVIDYLIQDNYHGFNPFAESGFLSPKYFIL